MVDIPTDLAAVLQTKMDQASDTSSKISDVPSLPSESSGSEDESEARGKDPKVNAQIDQMMLMRKKNDVFD